MFIAILLLCSSCFIGIGIFALCKKSPIWLWAGSDGKMKYDSIQNVKEFNRKNGIMWITFGASYLIPVVLKSMYVFPDWILGVFIVFLSIAGSIAMMLYWEHLHDRYTHK